MKENETIRHPSFGMVSVHRISGHQRLHGSEVRHMHFIGLTLKQGEVNRSLHQNWYSGHETLAEAWMSEAQFAEMITSPNIGDGVPCTIRYVQGDPVYPGVKFGRPLPPEPEGVLDQFKVEANDTVQNINALAIAASNKVDDLLTGKDKPTKATLKEIKGLLEHLRQEVASNSNFLLKQLTEQMEKTVSKAVTEFESHVAMSLAQRGLDKVAGLMETAPTLELTPGAETK